MTGMKKALEGFSDSMDGVPTAYAYKQQEVGQDLLTSPGWSSFLQAVVDAGLAIDATWPVRSESEGRWAIQIHMTAYAMIRRPCGPLHSRL
jgi:putative DNA methylase